LLQFLVDETLNLLPLDSSTPQQRLEQLMFRLEQHLEWHEAAVIDVSRACSRDADYQVNVGDLRGWEQQHGRQLIDRSVLIHTGYGRHWTERKRYLGTDKRGSEAVADLHFPGLAPEAALWLTEHKVVKSVGIDTASGSAISTATVPSVRR
jgi:kynurenine formamidase